MLIALKVTYADGEVSHYETSPAVMVEWENKTGKTGGDIANGKLGFADLCFWAHQCALRDKSRKTPLEMKQYLETLKNVEMGEADNPNPQGEDL